MKNETKNSRQTPMMKQYLEIKKRHPDEILFFRMGDFYEMFLEDAKIASSILDIALTARQNDIPMCGIPYHAMESYLTRLIKAGHRVAICEQMENVPSDGRGIVKREVVRIVTPGTIVESSLLQSDDNNYLASSVFKNDQIALAFVDISTGDFTLSVIDKSLESFRSEIAKKRPKEIVLQQSEDLDDVFIQYIKNNNISVNKIHEWQYDIDYSTDLIKSIFGLASISGLSFESDIEIAAVGSILQYLKDTHKKAFDHLKIPRRISSSDYMMLDEATISNLELVQNQQDRSSERTLFSILNYTKTAMGRRTIEKNILQPLLIKEEIIKRLDIVKYFCDRPDLTTLIQSKLKSIQDVERLVSRFTLGKSFPRDYLALMNSIRASIEIKVIIENEELTELSDNIPDMMHLAERIESAIHEEPALSPQQGRTIRKGLNSELDHLYDIKKETKTWILNFQEEEKEKLGIPTLRVKYNKILGYFIEVSKGQISKISDKYYRKQTLVGSERYTTERLQKFESEILASSDKIVEIEEQELEKLLTEVLLYKHDLQRMAASIGEIDFYCSLAISAIENRFSYPLINDDNSIYIKEGRHPVVERYFTSEVFIPNDVTLDRHENIIKIITGPNMSGKSTYIRMTAIIQLMMQIGSFVPAESANLGLVDRIFTRIGASDNISRGESTFLVEMNETALILNNATDRSLIIMDEIGRGTSTYDGLSIAWAVVEYISRYIKAKTLFATHYHELTKLENRKGIVNYNVLVKENISGVQFLHKVIPGSADKSYGIYVAKLAGIPKEIISNADNILAKMEKKSRNSNPKNKIDDSIREQLDIFNASNHLLIRTIKSIDVENITPLEAINELNRLKQLIE